MTDLGTQLPQQRDFCSSPDLSGVPGPSLQNQPVLVGELNPNTLEKRILQTAARTLSTSFCFRGPENLHSTRLHRHTHTSGRAGAPCPSLPPCLWNHSALDGPDASSLELHGPG